ncbi:MULTISPECIES: hypothetical protein [unclassified Mesorhizobium]|uniref:hypothetical protein n=1 Tax=unclassified Mesorhizobium TaxID=325217 RepID=UPI000FD4E032|nr:MULTISPECIES: hypothetical protein [unclassified Mesorhizobium]RUX01491.1 hypothetical protein EOA35_16680 [Mesorhizobium sp. M8A.F.Ca.ET.023.01.1.1]RUX08722.1 hypothetical protein EOA30_05990 [Mesorhizobium sp. M8A.F.Ca.ET.059.01.1.1]TGR38049.1 hypothetical protein EN842_46625 [bacterium M00.F.Ca.ET.199.01.1.1]TGU26343.1 hypothetical protein EN799_43180 [bacterium M00.F.Ca.ET.156.01.1.1]TGU99224.1 hypothetical protein EN794_000335 [Mesorhizobium sp. M00.F.Ca.ET.151.01.1.1]TGV09555.1 hypot
MIEITRRSALAIMAGGVASTGVAYAAVSSFSDEDLVRVTLEKYLGRLNMRIEHLQQFVLEFRNRNPGMFPSEKLSDAVTLLEKAKLGQARQLLPKQKQRDLGHFDRWVVAEFHMLTDYAWRGSPNDPIRFTGWQSCTNPFATLDPPKTA